MKTRAAVLREMGLPAPYSESRPLEIVDLELDPPGPGELLVRVRAAGLCHSDLSVINGTRPRVMPMALGHEAAGEVVDVGPGVESLKPGDHLVLAFVPACGECAFCLSGRQALCEPGAQTNANGTLLSGEHRLHDERGDTIHHHLGVSAFAEYIVVSEKSAVKIDPGLPFEIAALFGCAVMTGAGALLNTASIALPASSIAVFGLGGVGLAALLAAVSLDTPEVIAVDPVGSKLDLALDLGATIAINPHDGDVVEAVRYASGGGAEVALETVGSAAVLAQAYSATARGGLTVTAGLPDPGQMLSIPAVSLVAEERTLRGSYLGSCIPSRDIPYFIEMYRSGRLPVERLLSDRITLDDLNQGFDRLDRGEVVRQIVTL